MGSLEHALMKTNVKTSPVVYQLNHAITPKVLSNVAKRVKILMRTPESVSTKTHAKELNAKKTPRVKLVYVCATPDTTDSKPNSSHYNLLVKMEAEMLLL